MLGNEKLIKSYFIKNIMLAIFFHLLFFLWNSDQVFLFFFNISNVCVYFLLFIFIYLENLSVFNTFKLCADNIKMNFALLSGYKIFVLEVMATTHLRKYTNLRKRVFIFSYNKFVQFLYTSFFVFNIF